jgi:hypothetical protein
MKHLIKLIGLLAFGTAMLAIATIGNAAPTKPAKSEPVVVKGKKPAEKKAAPAPKKKDDGKIKPLDPNRKVPTLKKKYRKED